ncbi:hypothetical protein B296_00007708 [Ensete ventricosum]|uniref:phosphoglycerate mutase (2,3-diphosphoglycerate-independent) n=1 Tax=Ensete ventricosum TaxID=4639 RepID=A0A426ZHB2_ENSVE|nr:hypothetical protein B296_00007708 [Ensete ventricosum]
MISKYLPPFVIVDESGKAVGPIGDGDAVVTFNFRADRMVMVAKALEYKDFDKFGHVRFLKIRYAGMLQYDGELKLPSQFLVSPPEIERTSGEYLAADEAVKVSIAVAGPALAPGVRFLKGVPNDGLAIMNLHGFEAPSKYETTLIAVIDD